MAEACVGDHDVEVRQATVQALKTVSPDGNQARREFGLGPGLTPRSTLVALVFGPS